MLHHIIYILCGGLSVYIYMKVCMINYFPSLDNYLYALGPVGNEFDVHSAPALSTGPRIKWEFKNSRIDTQK
jgi:hypothetical protein